MKQYIYNYKDKEYRSITELLKNEDFKDITVDEFIDDLALAESKLAQHNITRTFHIPFMTEVKEEKYKELEQARKAEEMSPITVKSGTFEFDEDSQRRLNYAINAMTNDDVREWTLLDGGKITVTRVILEELFRIAIERSDATFAKLKRLKALVEPCKTKEEVAKIRWDMDLDVEE